MTSQNNLIAGTSGSLPGLTFVQQVNNAHDSLARWFSGPAAPTAAGLGLADLRGVPWHDTATNLLKLRDQADSAWIILGAFDETNKSFTASTAVTGFRNRLINGGFQIDQRNAGAAQTFSSGVPTLGADRWYVSVATAAVTGQRVSGPAGYPWGYLLTGSANNAGTVLGQRIESANCADLANQMVTGSLTVSSSSIIALSWVVYSANTLDNFAGKTVVASGSLTIGAVPARYSFSFNAGANAGNGLCLEFATVGLSSGQTIAYAGIQLEAGGTASAFEILPGEVTLARCQRYFQWVPLNAHFCASGAGQTIENTVLLPVTMRAAPTIGALAVDPDGGGGSAANVAAPTFTRVTKRSLAQCLTSAAAGDAYSVGYRASITAEL